MAHEEVPDNVERHDGDDGSVDNGEVGEIVKRRGHLICKECTAVSIGVIGNINLRAKRTIILAQNRAGEQQQHD